MGVRPKMKGFPFPDKQKETKQREPNPSDLRYSPEMKNPEELDRAQEGLSSYVRKNKCKY